ncbi:MAG: DUF4174 domain-containing protein [Gracilimonas sp.]|nr:DUF4174 domain-containing protein [Gracilimonas sp.]
MKSLFLIFIAGILLTVNLSAQMEQDFDLQDYRWNDRVLLIFSPNAIYTELTSTMEMVRKNQKGFNERDLKVFHVLENIGNSSGDNVLQKADAQNLRDRFDVGSSDFKIILIGKDGSEKMRSSEAITKNTLFEVIDAMPMRRLEMKEDG